MTRAIILLGTAAITLPFLIPMMAPKATVGVAVSERFLERSNRLPSETGGSDELITATTLRNWVTSYPHYARAYAERVIPFDFLYLAVLGGFLAIGATALASLGAGTSPLSRLPSWSWLILPFTYIATDILEDVLIIVLMTTPAVISDTSVLALAALRNIKLGSSALAIAQIFALGIASAIW